MYNNFLRSCQGLGLPPMGSIMSFIKNTIRKIDQKYEIQVWARKVDCPVGCREISLTAKALWRTPQYTR